MTTDWKQILKRAALALGQGLRFLARHLLTLLLLTGRFIVLRAIPVLWRWLRGTLLPALRWLYLQIPHRHAVVASTAGVAVIAIGVLFVHPFPSGSGNRHAVEKPVMVASSRHVKLVDQLLSGDWQRQKSATREVLESVGATILDKDAALPADDRLYVIQPELIMMAMDGARKETTRRLTLAELATMLADLGYPFPEGKSPVRLMEEGVRTWVKAALDKPDEAGADAALFLHAMAARQTPAIDLASADWAAEQHTLTHLELFAFTAALGNAFPEATPTRATTSMSRGVDLLANLMFPAAHAAGGPSNACAPTRDFYGKKNPYDQNKKTMEGTFNFGQNWAEGSDVGALKGAAKILSALGNLLKIQKLMMLYGSVEIRVSPDQKLVHKAAKNEAGKEVLFTATVGVDDEKYKEFEAEMNASSITRALKDCLSSLGLPMPTDINDIAGEMKDWEVSWDLYGDHATWTPRKNDFASGNQRRAPLKPAGKNKTESTFVVDIKNESHHEGDIVTGYIRAKATLHTDKIPIAELMEGYQASIETLKNGDIGYGVLGIAGTTVGAMGTAMGGVITGWIQRIMDPEAVYDLPVTYHEHRYPGYSYEGRISATSSHQQTETKRERSPNASDGIGFMESITTGNRQYNASMIASDMRPTRMSYTRYTERADTAYWELEGPSNDSASYSVNVKTHTKTGCAGQYKGARLIKDYSLSGSGSFSHPGTYAMKIEQVGSRDEGYQIHVYIPDRGAGVKFDLKTKEVVTNSNCEFLGDGYSSAESDVDYERWGLEGLVHAYDVDEPYPKRIAGNKTVTNPDGSETQWQWAFDRVGPIENPSAK